MQVDLTLKGHKNMDKPNNYIILLLHVLSSCFYQSFAVLYVMLFIYTRQRISFRGGDALVKLVLSNMLTIN